ncbi:pentapeptide repeat-containing protein [Streptomyces vietnamensis]|uniref:pentapeptide repeat-containing protein n=1 Tax=Streptomyces vietnamensis TaxID=362257 RepID=UPI001FE01E8E|nr:pentapeptide repeat-containing protein [Streptomyces vietnamensis]
MRTSQIRSLTTRASRRRAQNRTRRIIQQRAIRRNFSDQRGNNDSRHPQRLSLLVASLPGIAAVIALIFTWVSVGQAKEQLRVSEQGQITDRFNAAIVNLDSKTMDLRLGGVYGLQQIMRDSPRDQPTVISVLSAFIREHGQVTAQEVAKRYKLLDEPYENRAPTDIQAAINVLTRRPNGSDAGAVVDLDQADLHGMRFQGHGVKLAQLSGATLRGALLSGSNMERVDLSYAILGDARLNDTLINRSDMQGAILVRVQLKGAFIADTNISHGWLTGAQFSSATLTGDDLSGALLWSAKFDHASLADVDLSKASLSGADMTHAKLTRVNLNGADLTNADLRGAVLKGTNLNGAALDGAKIDGAVGLPRR